MLHTNYRKTPTIPIYAEFPNISMYMYNFMISDIGNSIRLRKELNNEVTCETSTIKRFNISPYDGKGYETRIVLSKINPLNAPFIII